MHLRNVWSRDVISARGSVLFKVHPKLVKQDIKLFRMTRWRQFKTRLVCYVYNYVRFAPAFIVYIVAMLRLDRSLEWGSCARVLLSLRKHRILCVLHAAGSLVGVGRDAWNN